MHHQHEQEWHTDASSWNHAVTSKWIKGCMQSKQKARFIYHTARNVSVSGSLSQKARQCVSFRVTGYPEVNEGAFQLPVCRQLAQNLIFALPMTPFAQVSWTDSRSSRKEDGMLFLRRQLFRTLSFAFGSSFILSRNQLGIAAQTTTQPNVSSPLAGAAVRDGIAGGTEMEKVTGIGGFFFRAKDPKALGLWYQQHLGVSLIPTSYAETPWQQEAGPTAFAPFKETSDYFGDTHKVWMLNFRVRDLDKMAAQLQAAGIEVKMDPQSYPNGRFARVHDPEGNPIELWQPKVPDTKG